MELNGALKKMQTYYENPVRYSLSLGPDLLFLNSLIGQPLQMTFTGKHICFCGNEVENTYRQNFCRDCFFTKPEASPTIFNPELSQAHLGIEDRDLEFEQRMQLKPHIVYLAKTDRIKVGITRKTQIPTRWIDQGADEAVAFLEVPNRYLAGVAEVALKAHFADKTSWRSMLLGERTEESILEAVTQAMSYLPEELKQYAIPNIEPWTLEFPVAVSPAKIKSLAFKKDKQHWSGTLQGIKGQYLILDSGVFNVRSHEGFQVKLEL